MQHRLFCNKKCVHFGIKLDAVISIWMQSGFDGFDFSATLVTTLSLKAMALRHGCSSILG